MQRSAVKIPRPVAASQRISPAVDAENAEFHIEQFAQRRIDRGVEPGAHPQQIVGVEQGVEIVDFHLLLDRRAEDHLGAIGPADARGFPGQIGVPDADFRRLGRQLERFAAQRQRIFRQMTVGDVAALNEHAVHHAVRIDQRLKDEIDVARFGGDIVVAAERDRRTDPAIGFGRRAHLIELGDITLLDQLGQHLAHRAADHAAVAIADQLPAGIVDQIELMIRPAQHRDEPRRFLEHLRQPRLVLRHRVRGAHPLGGFGDDAQHPADRSVILPHRRIGDIEIHLLAPPVALDRKGMILGMIGFAGGADMP